MAAVHGKLGVVDERSQKLDEGRVLGISLQDPRVFTAVLETCGRRLSPRLYRDVGADSLIRPEG